MTARVAVACAVALAAASPAAAAGSHRLQARLDARQQVPPAVGTSPRAQATLKAVLRDLPAGATLAWRLSYSGVSGRVRVDVRLGRAGLPGPSLLRLCSGCRRGAAGTVFLPPQVRSLVLAGLAYVSLADAAHPAGIARGQLVEARP